MEYGNVVFHKAQQQSTHWRSLTELTVICTVAQQLGKPTRLPCGLIPIRRHQPRKVETMILKWDERSKPRKQKVHELRDSNIYASKSLQVVRFCIGVDEASVLLGYHVASLGNLFAMFQDNVIVSCSRIAFSKKKNPLSQLDLWRKVILQGVKQRLPHLISLAITKLNARSKVART
jgi:hypothetical protein